MDGTAVRGVIGIALGAFGVFFVGYALFGIGQAVLRLQRSGTDAAPSVAAQIGASLLLGLAGLLPLFIGYILAAIWLWPERGFGQ